MTPSPIPLAGIYTVCPGQNDDLSNDWSLNSTFVQYKDHAIGWTKPGHTPRTLRLAEITFNNQWVLQSLSHNEQYVKS